METMTYGQFLLISMLRDANQGVREMPYDEQWEHGKFLYDKFVNSEFNVANKSEYDCISLFLFDQNLDLIEP